MQTLNKIFLFMLKQYKRIMTSMVLNWWRNRIFSNEYLQKQQKTVEKDK